MGYKTRGRHPKYYAGTELTTKHLDAVLGEFVAKLSRSRRDRPDLILATWPAIVGKQIAVMSQAVSYNEGVLAVLVKNSTLYALLQQNEKGKILKKYREKFPGVSIRDIYFKMG